MTSLWQLFLLFVRTSAFTFGGGYAMIPLLSAALVPSLLTSPEMANVVALAQMTPGAVGLNCATYVGFREFGLAGALICTTGLFLPCLIIGTLASAFRQTVRDNAIFKACLRGIRPLVIGLIAYVVLFFADGSLFTAPIQTLWHNTAESFGIEWRGFVIFAITLALELRFKLGAIWLLSTAGLLGFLLFLL